MIPYAQKEYKTVKIGDKVKIDNYYWMRDDSRQNPKVISHINRENDYAALITNENLNLQKQLYEEIKSHVKETFKTFPASYVSHDYKYFRYMIEGKSYPYYYQLNVHTQETSLLLDVNELSKGHEQCDVINFDVSLDEKYYSYCYDFEGNEQYNICIKTLDKDQDVITTTIPKVLYGTYIWSQNNNIYYTQSDSHNRICEVWLYIFQTRENILVYKEDNDNYSINIYTSADNKYLFISTGTYDSNKVYFINCYTRGTKSTKSNKRLCNEKGDGSEESGGSDVESGGSDGGCDGDGGDMVAIKLIKDIVPNEKYTVEHHDNYFYIKTNMDNCRNWKIMRASVKNVWIWTPYIKQLPFSCSYINDMIILKEYFIFTMSVMGSMYINVIKFSNPNYIKVISFNDNKILFLHDFYKLSFTGHTAVYTLSLQRIIYDSHIITLTYETMTSPLTYYEHDLSSSMNYCNKTFVLPTYANYFVINNGFIFKQVYKKDVPKYCEYNYICKRVYAPLSNSTMNTKAIGVPISIVYKKEFENKLSTCPLYVYGYGSYGHTVEPEFDYELLPLLDRGWIYAIAHVRGGSFLGTSWYEEGKLKNKMNTFNDFISSIEYLTSTGYGDKNNVTIEGRSAGGLLVGACTVLRPDLFKNVVAGVPFVDVLNTMSDSTIPLTVEEWTQWGNPTMTEYYDYMNAYCPYYNIKNATYPNMFITAGLHDPRVQYWEPLKWLAKIREHNLLIKSTQIIKVEMIQGHFGGSSRYKHMNETAEKYAFLLTRT
jgi:oligopeptidase B